MGHAKERACRKERAAREREKTRRIHECLPGVFYPRLPFVNRLPGIYENDAPTEPSAR